MWDYNCIIQVKHLYCWWQSFRHWPLGPGPLCITLQIPHKSKWAQVPPSFLPFLNFHTSPLQLCVQAVHNRVIDPLPFVAAPDAAVSALLFHYTLHLILLWSLWALNPDVIAQPQTTELLWLCCVPVASHSKAHRTKAHCLFLHEVPCTFLIRKDVNLNHLHLF